MKHANLMHWIACFRAARLAVHVCYGLLLSVPYPALSRNRQKNVLRRWSVALTGILNVRVIHTPAAASDRSGELIVANHISWLDILVLNSVTPTRFVAKSEVRHWPVIGRLCIRVNTIFVERHKRHDTLRVNRLAVEALQQGEQITLFPEGTTTDGTKMRHFHASLLQPAIDAGAPIRPIAIRYYDRHGRIDRNAAYIDDMSFLSSLWNILRSQVLYVQLTDLPLLPSTGQSRRALAVQAQRDIAAALNIPLPDEMLAPQSLPESPNRFQSMYHMLLPTAVVHETALQPAPQNSR